MRDYNYSYKNASRRMGEFAPHRMTHDLLKSGPNFSGSSAYDTRA